MSAKVRRKVLTDGGTRYSLGMYSAEEYFGLERPEMFLLSVTKHFITARGFWGKHSAAALCSCERLRRAWPGSD